MALKCISEADEDGAAGVLYRQAWHAHYDALLAAAQAFKQARNASEQAFKAECAKLEALGYRVDAEAVVTDVYADVVFSEF